MSVSIGRGIPRGIAGTSDSTLVLSRGWNLVSVPTIPPDFTASELFPDALAVFAYEPSSGTYVCVDVLENGAGYWARYLSDDTEVISGEVLTSISLTVPLGGWVLFGSLTESVPASSIQSSIPGSITAGPISYDDGVYSTAVSIDPGRGYWIRVNQPCVLSLTE